MNTLYEYGSPVDIILRVKSDRVIGGVEYKANEIYTIIKDVPVNFTYEATNTNMAAKKPIYSGDIQKLPTSVNTGLIDLTDKILNLVGTPQAQSSALVTVVEERQPYSGDGTIMLKWPAQNIFVYALTDGVKTSVPFIQTSPTTIKVEELFKTYTITYLAEKSQQKVFSLEQEYQPYFSAELVSKGNADKSTRNITVILPTVKINPNADLRFTNEGLLAISLNMDIIYQNQPTPTVVFD